MRIRIRVCIRLLLDQDSASKKLNKKNYGKASKKNSVWHWKNVSHFERKNFFLLLTQQNLGTSGTGFFPPVFRSSMQFRKRDPECRQPCGSGTQTHCFTDYEKGSPWAALQLCKRSLPTRHYMKIY